MKTIPLKMLFFICVSLLPQTGTAAEKLSAAQSKAFRSAFATIVERDVTNLPSEYVYYYGAASLYKFVSKSAFNHIKVANFLQRREEKIENNDQQYQIKNSEQRFVYENFYYVSRDINDIKDCDLLYFEPDEDTHFWGDKTLLISLKDSIVSTNDMSQISIKQKNELLNWPDPRLRPIEENPHFLGVYRPYFLP